MSIFDQALAEPEQAQGDIWDQALETKDIWDEALVDVAPSLTPETDKAVEHTKAKTQREEWLAWAEQKNKEHPFVTNAAGAVGELVKGLPEFAAKIPEFALAAGKIVTGQDRQGGIETLVEEAVPMGQSMAQGIQSPVGSKEWFGAVIQSALMAAPGLELARGAKAKPTVSRPPVQKPATTEPPPVQTKPQVSVEPRNGIVEPPPEADWFKAFEEKQRQRELAKPEAPVVQGESTVQGQMEVPDFAARYNPETLFQRPAWVEPGTAFDRVLGDLRSGDDPFKGSDITGIWKSLTVEQRQDLIARGWNIHDTRTPGQVLLSLGKDAVAARKYYGAQNRIAARKLAEQNQATQSPLERSPENASSQVPTTLKSDVQSGVAGEAPIAPLISETTGQPIPRNAIGVTDAIDIVQRRNAPEPVNPVRTGEFEQPGYTAIERPEPPPIQAPPVQKTGVSKIGQSIEAKAVEAKLTKGFADTAGFDPITIADQAARATNFVQSAPLEARAVVRGEKPLPPQLRGTSLITAMEEQLLRKPDPQLAYELANSPLTSATSAAAQEMRLMAERVPDSITAKFQEIRAAREAGSKLRGETPQKVVGEIQAEVAKNSSKRPTWEAFVKSLECV